MERKNLLLDTLVWVALCAAVITQMGCVIPALTGIKEWPTEDGPIKMITGADLNFGFSGTDSLDNRKGINAKELK